MPQRILLVLIFVSCLFSGCYSATPEPIAIPATQPPAAPTAAVTPELTETVKPTPAASPTRIATAAYPAPPTLAAEELAYPAPGSDQAPVPAASPYRDCARTPGITGCDPSAPRLAGRVAYYDTENNRLVGLDLNTGQGWAATIPTPYALEWSPDGSQLLVRMNFPKEQSDVYEYLLFGKDGKLIQQFTRKRSVYWQPQGAALRTYDEQKIVRSREGAEAWLGPSEKGKALHFRPSGKADWKTAELDVKPMEWPTELYGWIPGTPNIIITNGPGSAYNYVAHGYYLYLFNTQTEQLRSLSGFNGHLDPQFAAMRESDFAIIDLGLGLAYDTLAILDGKTGEISTPLPRIKGESQPYSLQQIAWQPGDRKNEGLFVMMVNVTRPELSNQQIKSLFPTSGIYFYHPATGETQILREIPENVVGGNFYWTADGQYLLYSVSPTNIPQGAQASLYVRQISTGKEWQVIDRLVNPGLFLSYISWNLIAVTTNTFAKMGE